MIFCVSLEASKLGSKLGRATSDLRWRRTRHATRVLGCSAARAAYSPSRAGRRVGCRSLATCHTDPKRRIRPHLPASPARALGAADGQTRRPHLSRCFCERRHAPRVHRNRPPRECRRRGVAPHRARTYDVTATVTAADVPRAHLPPARRPRAASATSFRRCPQPTRTSRRAHRRHRFVAPR
jgi:hypothetical protein